MSLYRELKRRNVIRVGIAYLAVAWLVTEVAGTLFPAFGIPDWGIRFLVIVFALGFVPALVISWAYEITPEGLKLEKDVVRDASITHLTAKRLDVFTIGLIVVALAFILADRFWLSPRQAKQSATSAEAVTDTVQSSEPESQYPPNSIAVLPFVNMSSDPEQEYFSDGISEELLNLLAKIPELRVAARTSSFSLKEQNLEIPEIAKRLKVAHVLEGSVRKAANQVRITAQLIKTDDGYHLWSESYDRTLDDIFAIQDEIAAEVVSALKITLLGETAPRARETNPEAYALYLQGKYFAMMSQFPRAEELLNKALAIDPDYAPAWERLAHVYINRAVTGLIGFDEGYRQARTFTHKALELDPDFARAHSGLAWIAMMYERNFAAAAAYLHGALALAPKDDIVLGVSAVFMETLGRLDEAIELGKQSIVLDPLNPIGYTNLAFPYSYVGQLDEAEAMFEKSLELRPDDDYVFSNLAILHLLQGRPEQALAVAEQVGLQKRRLWAKSMAHHDLGQAEESDAALSALKEGYADSSAAYIAEVHAWRGEIDSAFEWLDRAIDENQYMWGSLSFDPAFKNLHDDPRWQVFRTRVGRSEEQLKEIEFQF
jgi:TolB-like protein/Flp pilus assembly protein TadD